MAWNRHDRSGSIAGQDIIGNPDGDLFAVDRINGESAGENPGFLFGKVSAFEIGFRWDFFPVCCHNAWCSGVVISIDQVCSGASTI